MCYKMVANATKPLIVLLIDWEHCVGVEMESSHEKSKASVKWMTKALLTLGEAGSSRGAVHTRVHVLIRFDLLYQTQHVLADLFKL